MFPDELRKIEGNKCILFIRGFDPVLDNKIESKKHPLWNLMCDAQKGELFDARIERLRKMKSNKQKNSIGFVDEAELAHLELLEKKEKKHYEDEKRVAELLGTELPETPQQYIFRLDYEELDQLAEQLKEHSITRKYHAIVHGNLKEDTGTVNAPIGRHPTDRKKMSTKAPNGRHAVTHYRVLERFGNFTYIECQLETGRTHQIRVHMSSIGHPILGDEIYGPTKCPYKLQGQTLHAKILGITHPSTGEYIEFDAPLPDYFKDLLNKLRKQN